MPSARPPEKVGRIVIIGAGETAEMAHQYFTFDSPYAVKAFAVEAGYATANELFDLPVVAFEDVERAYPPAEYDAFIAVSYAKLNRVRTRLYHEAKRKGYRLVSYVSSRAFVWSNVTIGDNCFVLEHNVVQYKATIGNNVTLWSGNHIGHRSWIRDNCFIASHAVVSGYCEIGESCFLGVNSCIADHVKIAPDCLIGMGAVVQKNTRLGEVYRGARTPAAEATSYDIFKVGPAERPMT